MGFSRGKTPLRMTEKVDGILTWQNTAQNDGEVRWDSHVAYLDSLSMLLIYYQFIYLTP